jgi:hypothetical protein
MIKIQEFRPADLPRILEKASPDLLDKVVAMAADSLEALATLPRGQGRDEAIADAAGTVEDVLARRRRR